MTCIDCHSPETELVRGDDDRHEKRCHDCGYEWGPFVSNQGATRQENSTTNTSQPSMAAFTGDTETDQ